MALEVELSPDDWRTKHRTLGEFRELTKDMPDSMPITLDGRGGFDTFEVVICWLVAGEGSTWQDPEWLKKVKRDDVKEVLVIR